MEEPKWNKMPVFKKAEEILELVERVSKLIEEIDGNNEFENDSLRRFSEYMRENALIIPAKIAGAHSEETLYDLRMENATIIRKAAREILNQTTGLKMHGFVEVDYLELIRNEIEEFRILFAEWVKTFDQWNYIIDRWGLFNPPGINYDDYDIDDDLPFDNPFLDDED